MPNVSKGKLVEYSLNPTTLELIFEFNPQNISRTRSITIKTGGTPATRGGYDFNQESETPRVAQGVSVEAEKFDLTILLDATDRMNNGDPIALQFGIEPEIATLRSMVELKLQGTAGAQTLSSLGQGGTRAFQRDEFPSVLLFTWGQHILPVFLASVKIDEKAHLPSLIPYRAEVSLSMQVIEGNNPFYTTESKQQIEMATRNTGQAALPKMARGI